MGLQHTEMRDSVTTVLEAAPLSAPFMKILEQLLSQPGFSPAMLVLGVVNYALWTAAYLLVIRAGFRQKSYGIPFACIPINITWEFLYSTRIVTEPGPFFIWANRVWLGLDAIILYQLFRYGREMQVLPWIKAHFHAVALFALALAASGLTTFEFYFNDVKGVASSMFMNFVMSILFILMLFNRPDLRGMSYGAAWCKMLGTAGSAVFLYFWWPAQFKDGILIGHPNIHEPLTYGFMYFLYVSIFVIDCIYIRLFTRRLREIRSTPTARAS